LLGLVSGSSTVMLPSGTKARPGAEKRMAFHALENAARSATANAVTVLVRHYATLRRPRQKG
jgi:hypothetical protein